MENYITELNIICGKLTSKKIWKTEFNRIFGKLNYTKFVETIPQDWWKTKFQRFGGNLISTEFMEN